ncbi:sn-glycerol-3-phosphate transport system permease protein UgpA [Pseudovibrio sp. Ad13]|jgi:glucose/mannose transport system permease protein|uniref:carbohydrate ABC transporter permease n=1 Tax=unclassified Pseudovibrio TaxID=2627060 RepID=UPI0007AE6539|nr:MULTISPECIES: sugar ABC transporter permease [unclassified Pseudovibrio]KZK82876.1 sn-glycerol-3-phosphate transport system permease protein UgpA [Pseudovibrio sp. Ad13]KZK90303.1 sn-glycerol-3-phosphate transport system permease protein UgpA [Pseudovibrio sp. Ad46]KZK96924.1 sn-glycerol-3-phosphate transport system permease protein UgpA [Pseudovibrio sp. Ad5]
MSNPQQRKQQMSVLDRLQRYLPQLVVAPPFLLLVFFVYGFIAWTGIISLTNSRMLPTFDVQGIQQYVRLLAMDRWNVAFDNLLIFGSLYILFSITIGCVLAVLLDQRIRAEGALRTIYLYPMAISFIVTGTAWKWILNPSLGIESYMQKLGWESFQFDWIVNRDMAIYVVVLAAVWQASGFVMALFLSALRTVDEDIIRAAHLDGASTTRIYFGIILPSLRPVFLSAFVILAHLSIKSFDLVVALTNGGPGYSSTLPANFMYEMAFRRNQIGLGAASAMMMLATVAAIIVPYLYSELRAKRHG